MLSMFAINYDKPSITNDDPLNDTNFIKYFNGNDNFQGPEERKKTVWEQFVFQDFRLTFDSGRGGLQDYLTRQFQAATDEFDRQWKRYLKERADKAPTPAQWRFGGYSPNYSEFVFNPGYLGLPPQITCAYHLHVKSPIVSAACQP
jgi:hypothetical protein